MLPVVRPVRRSRTSRPLLWQVPRNPNRAVRAVTPSLNHWTSRGDLRNRRDVAHPVFPPPLLHYYPGAATIPKKPRGRGLSWATRLLYKGGVGGVALGCGLQASGSGPGCAGCAGGGEACNLVSRYPRTPRKPTPFLHTLWGPMSGSVDFSQMARSWALVPRPGAAAAARRHPATCRLLQPTPDPNTGGEVRAGWLAGRAGQATQVRYVPTHPVLEVFGSRVVAWSGCWLSGQDSFICFHG